MFAYFDIPNIADKFRWCIRKKIVLSERTYLDLKAIQFHKRTVKKNTVIIRKMNTRKPDSSECRTFYVQNLNGKKSYFSLTIQISNFIDIFGPVFRSWVEIQTKNVQRFQVFNVVFKQWLEFGTFNRRMAVDHLNTNEMSTYIKKLKVDSWDIELFHPWHKWNNMWFKIQQQQIW